MEASVRRKAVDFARRLGNVAWTPIDIFDLIIRAFSFLNYYIACIAKIVPCYRIVLRIGLLLLTAIHFVYLSYYLHFLT